MIGISFDCFPNLLFSAHSYLGWASGSLLLSPTQNQLNTSWHIEPHHPSWPKKAQSWVSWTYWKHQTPCFLTNSPSGFLYMLNRGRDRVSPCSTPNLLNIWDLSKKKIKCCNINIEWNRENKALSTTPKVQRWVNKLWSMLSKAEDRSNTSLTTLIEVLTISKSKGLGNSLLVYPSQEGDGSTAQFVGQSYLNISNTSVSITGWNSSGEKKTIVHLKPFSDRMEADSPSQI